MNVKNGIHWIWSICFLTALFLLAACFATPSDRPRVENYPNFRIQFINDRVGWIVGPRLLRTVDKGSTWEIIKYSRPEDAIRADDGPEYRKDYVQFVDADWGWRCSPIDLSAVEYTMNAGRSWSEPVKTNADSRCAAVIFINRDYGWMLGTTVFVTHDRGRAWHEEKTLSGLNLRYPYFLDQDHGWIANEKGTVARTTNGGETWNVIQSQLKDLRNIFFRTPTQGWIVGDGGLLATTTDGGVHWTKGSATLPYDSRRNMRSTLLDIFFLTPTLGWIAGYDGRVLGTTDGGQSWTLATTPTHAPLSSIRFVDALHGWAVGGNPEPAMPVGEPSNVVIETTDGGRTWRINTFL
jgi:photosystem II stability/assembly factor-like uncharacterized protein